MFQFFPFTNAHQLNLDWILETLQTFPRTVNNTLPDDNGNINLPTVSGMSSWNEIGADGAGNVDPIETISDLDNVAIGLHFYKWENPDTYNNPYGAAENVGYMLGNGGGICLSYVSAAGHAVQIANNAGSSTIAIRHLNAGDPWSTWRYDPWDALTVSPITFNASVVDTDEPSNVSAYIRNGYATIYIECRSIAAVGTNDTIASGLPLPANPGPPCYAWGAIQDINTAELKPCRFLVQPTGLLDFSYLGHCDNAHDVISVILTYPVL